MQNEKNNKDVSNEEAEKEPTKKLVYEPPKLKKFEKLQKLIVSGE